MEDFNKHKKYLQSFAVRGRSLSPDQNYLMLDVLKKFSASVNCERIFENIEQCERKINFEIGFGDGKNLIERATKFPEQIFIGCEVYKKGLFRVASYIKDNDIANIYFYEGDGREFIAKIPDNSLFRIYILFPDPWPKVRHNKRRIINSDSLKLFASKMGSDGLLYTATDDRGYAEHMLCCFENNDFTIKNLPRYCKSVEDKLNALEKPSDWRETKYEAKAIELSKKIFYIVAMKI